MADPDIEIYFDDISHLWEDEELFARDSDGQLMRLVKATEKDFKTEQTLVVDGESVTVMKAVPLTDAQGNVQFDELGNTIFRRTTIWDAAQERYVKKLGATNPVPILCHQEHLRPAAVCRVCAVQTFRIRNGVRSAAGKLLPACFQPCEVNMEVVTVASPEKELAEKVRKSVSMLTEMLCADHLFEDRDPAVPHELADLAKRLGSDPTRFKPHHPVDRPVDTSSELIRINHNACILCDRCARSCTDVKENFVIARSGKGYTAQISFDLNDPMGESTCVSCGECMMNCPTDALTFLNPVKSEWWATKTAEPSVKAVTAAELKEMDLFKAINYKFLQWNAGAVVKRKVKKGEVLCVQGEYGASAFIINKGELGVYIGKLTKKARRTGGFFGDLLSRFTGAVDSDAPKFDISPGTYGKLVSTLGPEDLIFGEMTCMNSHPRTATVIANGDGEVLEIRRNVLYMLQRQEVSRRILDRVYRERALASHLNDVLFFQDLTDEEKKECVGFLREKVTLMRVEPGQVLFRQGQLSDAFYMIRLGHVKVSQIVKGEERVLQYLRPNHSFGEIGLVSNMAGLLGQSVPDSFWGRRTATCTALDDVELVCVKTEVFNDLVNRFPKLLKRVVDQSRSRLEQNVGSIQQTIPGPLGEFLDQGLFNGQKLLVLDLEKCTRCDECSKACSDTHGGVTRLVREGLRFDRFLVASACRSCTDPYCMVGCPVDSIHREGSLNITIEDHCIGCGLCAKNCPYGNINMAEFLDEITGRSEKAVVRMRATTCDLCESVPAVAGKDDVDVSCVYACPHDAAFRMTGQELFENIAVRSH